MEASSRGDPEARAPPESDGEVLRLTAAISRGDAEAFGRFYETWFDRAYRLARALTRRDESFCLDVVQDSMLRVVRCLKPMASRESLDRWFARVIHTTAIDGLRREARRLRREARLRQGRSAAGTEDGGPLAVEVEEEIAWLRSELGKLQERDRALVSLRFEEGRTLRAAGAAVGITGHAAHGRIRRILEMLRRRAREVFHERS